MSLRLTRLTALCVAALQLAHCGSDPSPPKAATPPIGAVYSEVSDFQGVATMLPTLARQELGLIQVVRPEDIGAEQLAALIRASAKHGVEFRAWLVLGQDQGYWPGETNASEFGAAVDTLLAWLRKESLPVGWVTFDMEPDLGYTRKLVAIASDASNPSRTSELVALIQSHKDPVAYRAAKAQFAAILDRVHSAGLRAHVVTYPIVLDDAADGDEDLQDAFDTPVAGLPWDEVSFMVYRSVMEQLSGAPVTTDLFCSYAKDAKASFGARSGIDFGVLGGGVVGGEGSYRSAADLRADVGCVRGEGVAHLHLYSLEGARSQAAPDDWLSFARSPSSTPAEVRSVYPVRAMFSLLDGILDTPP